MGKIEKIQRFVEKGKVDKLAAITQENDKEIRMAAVDGLGKLIENEMALYALAGMMDDPDADIRRAVVLALGNGNGSYVETQLQYCLDHEKNGQVLEAAREALKKVKGNGETIS